MAIDQDITNLPTPPSRSDSPSDFSDKADTFLAALPQLQTELNLYADEANTTQTEINLSETNAATSEQNAQGWASDLSGLVVSTDYSAKAYAISSGLVPEGSAKDWAIKIGSEVDGNDFSAKKYAIDAEAAATTAQVTANAAPWQSGTTYNTGDVVIGTDANTYRSLIDGNVGNNPVTGDGTNWKNLTAAALVTKAELTKTFTSGEEVVLSLEEDITTAPVVSVTKEVPQPNQTNNDWDVASDGTNYTLHDTAYSTTLTPSDASADGTFTLGTGSFAEEDVGKRIEGNGGVAFLTATDGSYAIDTPFNDTSTIAAGDWSMFALDVESVAAGFGLSNTAIQSTFFDIENASYNNISFNTSSEDDSPKDVAFNNNGTKMYVAGDQNKTIFQYTLSEEYNLNTASYDNVSFSVLSEDVPDGITFNTNGTKMYMVSNGFNSVYQYTLTTPFDLSTSSYDNVSFDVTNQDVVPLGISFNNDGTAMYIVGRGNSSIFQYTLSTAFDLSTASYNSVFYSVASQEASPFGVEFNSDGTKMYVAGYDSDSVYQYSLSSPFDVSSASYDSISFDISSQETDSQGIAFDSSGSRMYICGFSGSIYQYSVAQFNLFFPTSANHTAITSASTNTEFWTDINSMTADDASNDGSVFYAVSTDGRQTWKIIDDAEGTERAIVRNNAGTWEYNDASDYGTETWVAASENDEFYALEEAVDVSTASVTTAYDLENASYDNVSFDVSSQSTNPSSVFIEPQGNKLFLLGSSVWEYDLSSPFDVSTAQYNNVSFSFANEEDTPYGLFFKPDGTKMYMGDLFSSFVFEYNLSNAFDVSSASYSGKSVDLSTEVNNLSEISIGNNGSYLYAVSNTDSKVFQYNLSIAWDINSASYSGVFLDFSSQETDAYGLWISSAGESLFISGNGSDQVHRYNISTPWDLSTSSYSGESLDASSEDGGVNSISFDPSGANLYLVGGISDDVFQYTTGSTTSTNRMDATQLDAVSDANHYTLGDDLDLAVTLTMPDSGSTSPTSDGVSINYDAQVKNVGAILGADYEWDRPAADTVNFKALSNENFKIRVV